jgi:hypothetical protein
MDMEHIKLGYLISLQKYFILLVIMIYHTELQDFTQFSLAITVLDLTVHEQHFYVYVLESVRPGLSPSAIQLE